MNLITQYNAFLRLLSWKFLLACESAHNNSSILHFILLANLQNQKKISIILVYMHRKTFLSYLYTVSKLKFLLRSVKI